MTLPRTLWLAAAVALGACSSEPEPPRDAGPDGGDGDVDGAIDLEPPALPVLTPCPEGWREVPPDPADPYGYATCDPWPDGDPVTLPVLTPCPDGWREAPHEDPADPLGVTTCDPWPESGHEACAAVDEAHFPGEDGCVRVGSACPAGDWADDLPDEVPILYVREGEAAGGDGTRELPFGTIADAMAAATPGTIIALSRGTFDEEVELETGVTLWGACVAGTLVTCSIEAAWNATVTVDGSDTVVRNLRVGGNRNGVVANGSRCTLEVEGVVIDGAAGVGLTATNGAGVVAHDLVIRDTRSFADGTWGTGLQVEYGALVEVRRAALERNGSEGVKALDEDTSLFLEDVSVVDTMSAAAAGAGSGAGLVVALGAGADVRRAMFERNRGFGVTASDAGTTLALIDVVVRDTQVNDRDRTGGYALNAESGALVHLSRGLLQRSRSVGVFAYGEGAQLEMSDVVVRETLDDDQDPETAGGTGFTATLGAQADFQRVVLERNELTAVDVFRPGSSLTASDLVVRDNALVGLSIDDGARVDVSRAVLERNVGLGVLALGEDTTFSLTDAVVRDTTNGELDQDSGGALEVSNGAQADVRRAVFERNQGVSVVAASANTQLTLDEALVSDTRFLESGGSANGGLQAFDGALVAVTRTVFERNTDLGLAAWDVGTTLELEDVIVRDTLSRGGTWTGRGLEIDEAADARATRVAIEGSHGQGMWASGEGTAASLTDVVVRGTLASEGWGGNGIGAYGGARVEVTSFVVTGNELCGLQLAHGQYLDERDDQVRYEHGGTMDLREGEISDNEVCGINVQTEDFDVRRLLDRVVFRDNGVNLDMGDDIYVPTVDPPGLGD
jgi:hypothetical protein